MNDGSIAHVTQLKFSKRRESNLSSFKSGTQVHDNGKYLRITAGPLRYKYVHIIVAEGMLGRELTRDEHVHHIDGNQMNCKWTNLLVVGNKVHNAVSNRQYWYLKQKFSREESAWRAYFDITGNTPMEDWARQTREVA
jgi:HNH endonuclease